LLHVAHELANRRGDLIGAMILDAAKTVSEADAEVSEAVDFANYYARALDNAHEFADCTPTPLGVVVVTPPWNFPLAIPAGGVLAALMAGNAVILKPAPEAALVGWELAQAMWAAGVPKDALQFLPCPDNEIGQRLITDVRVGAVILTGSFETAQLFLGWKPGLRLFAETSGKNSLIISALADQDQAIKDLVRSAFGHNGQKCSAASLAVCEAEVYDDPTFRRQLRDAVASLRVGSAWEASSVVTPLTQPASGKLLRALTQLDEGEEWLLEPQQDESNPQLWSPGIKLGVQPGSFFHQTECFGPVLGLMRAHDLDEAISIANATEFGLTSGIHSLDDREVTYWKERIQAGNIYINRHITGAIVQRQPFGGWKRSTVGPGAKAGGPNYVLQLMQWQQANLRDAHNGSDLPPALIVLLARMQEHLVEHLPDAESQQLLRASAGSYLRAWQSHFSQEHDPSQVLGEANHLRYRPCRGLLVRAGDGAAAVGVAQVILAVRATGQDLTLSVSPGQAEAWEWLTHEPNVAANVALAIEDDSALAQRLATQAYDRLRALSPLSQALQRAAHAAQVNVIDAPTVANGRLELRWYLREQAVSHTRHRYGNLL
jgi:RHH-type proline utilization regulon transcriptional repressor/proline dehydrogenase/delta 1-pyrroline-5-carboxylate dehydrogenase